MANYQHRVLYGDTDQMGVVYYANYLRFFEAARNEWIRGLGLPYTEIEQRGVMLPVVEASAKYLRPAKYDDVIEIATVVTHTRVRVRFEYVVRRVGDETPLVTGHTVHACMGRDGRVMRAPDWLLAAMEGHSQRMNRTEE